MDQETAQIALKFMERVQLQGVEVPAFARVCESLARIANPGPPVRVVPAPQPE